MSSESNSDNKSVEEAKSSQAEPVEAIPNPFVSTVSSQANKTSEVIVPESPCKSQSTNGEAVSSQSTNKRKHEETLVEAEDDDENVILTFDDILESVEEDVELEETAAGLIGDVDDKKCTYSAEVSSLDLV